MSASSVIRSTSPVPLVDAIASLAPQLPDDLLGDLLQIHNAYIQGNSPVSAEIGASLARRQVFVIPKKGTVLDLLAKPKEGADKIEKKVLFIDAQGRPSLKMLSIAKRNNGEQFAKIAEISRLFPSRHILCLRHFQFANRHYLLSPLKCANAYRFFYHWKSSCDPASALLDVFIGAFKGLAALHAKGHIHTDLGNPTNILIEKRLNGRITGIIADLDKVHANPSTKQRQQDVRALLYSFRQTMHDMKRKDQFPSLIAMRETVEGLLDKNLSAETVVQQLQEIRAN